MKRLIGAAVAAALLLAAPAANAAIMLATYSGTATGHFHYAFGMEDSGTADFVATFTFDTDLGLYETEWGMSELNGGDGWGYASPITNATLTINGITLVAPPAQTSWVANADTFVAHQYRLWNGNFGFTLLGTGAPSDLTAEYSFPTTPVYSGIYDDSLRRLEFNGVSLTVQNLSSAVPEPATWAMMIIGFGAVGSMVRASRRRQLV